MQNLWNIEDQRLLECLNKYILSGPTLARPYPYIRFYIKIYWYKYGMLEVLLQADILVEAINSEAQEKYGGKWKFEKSL